MTQTEQNKQSISDDISVTDNLRISDIQDVADPKTVIEEHPLPPSVAQLVTRTRAEAHAILHGQDDRVIVIVGPCSIHDPVAALDYGARLEALRQSYSKDLLIIMRVYFEKPRTTVGWKGLINDPNMDGSFDVETGLLKARELLIYLTELGLPLATEALDPISPQYLAELFSWAAIGARTTESQTHREMASGLSMPIGFKNGTNGSLDVAINALQSAASSHRFMGINRQGQVALIKTSGNPDGHVILRGGKQPNYDSVNVAICEKDLAAQSLDPAIVVDCSHGNSNKDYRRQPLVAENVVNQIIEGNKSIIGIMLESNLKAGNQSASLPKEELEYGVSVTDACIDMTSTEEIFALASDKLQDTLKVRIQ